jgi:hypothetical protein
MNSWLDRQARTVDQRMDISVALLCAYFTGIVALFTGPKWLGSVCFWLTEALVVVIFGFLLRDNWETHG